MEPLTPAAVILERRRRRPRSGRSRSETFGAALRPISRNTTLPGTVVIGHGRRDSRVAEPQIELGMHPGQDKDTFGRARLSFADEADIDAFVTMLDKFERGEITPDEWRGFRLLRGRTASDRRPTPDASRQDPAGPLSRPQLDALADVAERYSRGFGHITNTSEHPACNFLKLPDVEPAMRHLADAGLTTREAAATR